MATRSLIGLKLGRTVNYVLCHFDGDMVGETLFESYGDCLKTVKLLNVCKDIRSLKKEVEETSFFEEKITPSIVEWDYIQSHEFRKQYWDVDYFYIAVIDPKNYDKLVWYVQHERQWTPIDRSYFLQQKGL